MEEKINKMKIDLANEILTLYCAGVCWENIKHSVTHRIEELKNIVKEEVQ